MLSELRRDGAVSLVVAITGHRDLHAEDAPGFEAEIRKIFVELTKEKYPETPLLLLSGLAEGGDRIAVRVAIALGIPYIAVLPMPANLYRQDFTSEASDAEFEDLQTRALRRLELPLDSESSLEAISRPGKERDRQYEALGRFLVQYSQILIAIWDQDGVSKPGGTGHVVAMKLRDQSSFGRAFSRMNTNGAGPVYVLPARRISSGRGATPALKRDPRYPGSSVAGDFEASYKLLNQFNADVKHAGPRFSQAVERSRLDLFEGAEAIGVSEPMEWVATRFAWADALAIRFSGMSLRLWKVAFSLLAVSGVALAWLHTMEGGTPALCAYYACLLIASLLLLWEWRTGRRNRHEDYRAFAEALRVQFFWMAAGLPDLAAEQYLSKQSGEVVWIRDAISECGLYDDVLDRSPVQVDDRALRLRLAHTWVAGQAKYFWKTERLHRHKKITLTVFASVAAAVGFAAPLFGVMPPFEARSHIIAAIALWWSALAWNYIERRGFAQEARQYGRMYDLFHAAADDLKQVKQDRDLKESEETIRELGRQALAENADWLTMHRERKLTPGLLTG